MMNRQLKFTCRVNLIQVSIVFCTNTDWIFLNMIACRVVLVRRMGIQKMQFRCTPRGTT